jgi:(p)ppGpp synthase/HD superfamily hydrolase
MSTVERAEALASAAHEGQCDKRGGPFMDHVRRVADRVLGDDAKTVAFLHDIVEKGPGWTLERLRAEGFAPHVVAAVDALTRRGGEPDDRFVHRADTALARAVKRADVLDNLDSARRFMGGPEADEKVRRYEADLAILDAVDRA